MNCGLFRSRNSAVSARVAIARLRAVAVALEKAQRHQRVEEIGIGARVQAERRAAARRRSCALAPSVVNSPSSTAESRTLAGQKAMPTSMIRAGDSEGIGVERIYFKECSRKKDHISSEALILRLVGPSIHSGNSSPPGQVCPPPSMV